MANKPLITSLANDPYTRPIEPAFPELVEPGSIVDRPYTEEQLAERARISAALKTTIINPDGTLRRNNKLLDNTGQIHQELREAIEARLAQDGRTEATTNLTPEQTFALLDSMQGKVLSLTIAVREQFFSDAEKKHRLSASHLAPEHFLTPSGKSPAR